MIAGVIFIQEVPVGLTGERNDRFRTDAGWNIAVQDDGAVRIHGETTSGRAVDFLVYDVPYVIVHAPAAGPPPRQIGHDSDLSAAVPVATRGPEESTTPETQPANSRPKGRKRGPALG